MIVLVRHGRSAHVHAGWLDYAGFLRWREAYEAAGIAEGETAPAELQRLASSAMVVASDAPRGIASARLLAPDGPAIVSPLLRELDLPPPRVLGLRLPLGGWALLYGVRMLFRGSHVSPAERARASDTARWLAALAADHGRVVAVTHHSFRSELAKALEAAGWRGDGQRRRSRHWSAWVFVDRD